MKTVRHTFNIGDPLQEWLQRAAGLDSTSNSLPFRLPYLQDGEFEPDDLYSGTLTKAPL
ncbi:hypothetical protein RhiirA4_546824 [Rhizophagus irregularis]|uniref:Uncharacterized protein n=1 Tax=Rhizophagus irregularis TaxID=588596 RepID=A0A2I1GZ11_9GLOM|nr:hypothetical protein RhiirA4_546824 [Rhizophagus irregularis]